VQVNHDAAYLVQFELNLQLQMIESELQFKEIQFGGVNMLLLPEKAVFMPETQSLLLADTHFGKATHFRKAGIPVSDQVFVDDLERLSSVIQKTSALELIILGDLFHSDHNSEWERWGEWIKTSSLKKVRLVPGNHDKAILKLPPLEGCQIETPLMIQNNIALSHEDVPCDLPLIHGHIHPSVSLKGLGKQAIKLPCFHVSETRMVIPAFGSFTGTHAVKPRKGDRVFVLHQNLIHESKLN